MIPVWALSILFLNYTLGFPIRNITSSEFDDLNLNLTNSSDFDDVDDLNLNLTDRYTTTEFDDVDDLNLNLTNRFNSVQNITYYWPPNQKNISFQIITIPGYNISSDMLFLGPGPTGTGGCKVFSCIMNELGSRMQIGDETAGESTRDPYGPGKK